MNLKSKYIIFTTFILFLTIGAFSYNTLKLQEKEIYEDEKEKVTLIAEIIKNGLLTTMLEGRGKEFQKFLENIVTEDIEKAWIFRSDGTIISSSIPSQIHSKIPEDHAKKIAGQKIPEVFFHEKEGVSVYSIMIPIRNEYACAKCHGTKEETLGVLDVEASTKTTVRKVYNARKRIIIFGIVTLLVISFSIGILTTYLVNKPISLIMNTMKKAESGDLSVKFITGKKDEIGNLASSLNSMLFELDKARREIEKCHVEEIHNIEKMATIGELASAIAHEIKNPLAGISGAIQVLAEDFPENDSRREVISEVLHEIERLDRSIKDLLVFARPPELHFLSAPLQPIIERAIQTISLQAKKQGVIIKSVQDDNVSEAHVDPEQIQQVFSNIMLNALQSMPEGGTLATSIHMLPSDEIEATISDTGQGIDEEGIRSLFKPFFTTRHAGAGLGLAISRNIVEKHGGRITAESRIGIGSTFHVILKANKRRTVQKVSEA